MGGIACVIHLLSKDIAKYRTWRAEKGRPLDFLNLRKGQISAPTPERLVEVLDRNTKDLGDRGLPLRVGVRPRHGRSPGCCTGVHLAYHMV